MRADVLDRRDEAGSTCFLCRISLEDYVAGLPDTYWGYDIQREIVSNAYLDHLVDTVLHRRHIPPIVLVVDEGKSVASERFLEVQTFKILDGLQRTFRLQAIRKTISFCLEELDPTTDYLSWKRMAFSREFSEPMRDRDSNTDVLRAVLRGHRELGEAGLLETFSANGQWFEIWTGLTPDEEVRKMLTLNAGHKPVKTRHQLELLFLNLLPILREDKGRGFNLVRERETSATQFSKGRPVGTFHFAHVVTALLSFHDATPVAPSTALIQGIQGDDAGIEQYSAITAPDFLKEVVGFLVSVDRLISGHFGEVGALWMGREVTLAGLFGALGSAAHQQSLTNTQGAANAAIFHRFLDLLHRSPDILNLREFEAVRNSVDLSKVNIGNVNRAAVFSGVRDALSPSPPAALDWSRYFGGQA